MSIFLSTVLVCAGLINLILGARSGGYTKEARTSDKLLVAFSLCGSIGAFLQVLLLMSQDTTTAYVFHTLFLLCVHLACIFNLFFVQSSGSVYFGEWLQGTYSSYLVIIALISFVAVALPGAGEFRTTQYGMLYYDNANWVGRYILIIAIALYMVVWAFFSYRAYKKALFKREKKVSNGTFIAIIIYSLAAFFEIVLPMFGSGSISFSVIMMPIVTLIYVYISEPFRNPTTNGMQLADYVMYHVDDAYVLMDSLGNIIKANYNACQMLDAKYETIATTRFEEWAKYLNEETADNIYSQMMNRNETIHTKAYTRHTGLYIETVGHVIYDRYGQVLCVLLLLKDTSKVEEYEKSIENAHRDVELANKAKEAFMHRVNKGMKEPLVSIIEATRSTEDEVPDMVKPRLLQMRENASELLGTLNDMIDIASMESDSFRIEEVKYNIKEMLDSVLMECAEKINEDAVKLISNINTSIPMELIGDAMRLRQVIFNLLENAVKYTAGGYVTLTLDYRVHYRRVMLNLSVSDTGIGIRQENMEKIFGVVNNEEDGIISSMGDGLGLALCRNIVKLMGGEISVKSAFGRGTTFSVTLEQKIESEKSVIPFMEYKENVLVIEEDQLILDAEEIVLKEMGMQYDVLLLSEISGEKDIPKMGGYSVIIANNHILRRYRQLIRQNFPNARIIGSYSYSEYKRLDDKSQAICSPLFFSQIAQKLDGAK